MMAPLDNAHVEFLASHSAWDAIHLGRPSGYMPSRHCEHAQSLRQGFCWRSLPDNEASDPFRRSLVLPGAGLCRGCNHLQLLLTRAMALE